MTIRQDSTANLEQNPVTGKGQSGKQVTGYTLLQPIPKFLDHI